MLLEVETRLFLRHFTVNCVGISSAFYFNSFKIDQKYFNYATGLTMTNENFDKLFGEKPRNSEDDEARRGAGYV